MRPRLLPLLALALLAAPVVSQGQSLAEAAAKEREKRKGKKAPTVLTEFDLRSAGRAGTANVDTGAAPVAAPSPAAGGATAGQAGDQAGESTEKTPEELRSEQEAAWRDRLQKARQNVQRLGQLAQSIQNNLNDITGNIYGSQRTTLIAELEKTKAELQQAQQQVADLEEEGRRSRFRP